MKKRIADMTPQDKAEFLEATKRDMALRGISWVVMKEKIQKEIDATFDDERFVKMDAVSRIDAAFARKEFGDKKPDLVAYLLWSVKFVAHCEEVEW